MQGILQLSIEEVVSLVQPKLLSLDDAVEYRLVKLLHAGWTSNVRSVSKVDVLIVLEDCALFL